MERRREEKKKGRKQAWELIVLSDFIPFLWKRFQLVLTEAQVYILLFSS